MANKKHSREATPRVKPQPANTPPPQKAAAPPPDWRAVADRYARPVLIGLLVLAFLLRVVNLDALTLWVDEFVHVLRAKDYLEGKGPLFTDDNNGILLTFIILPLFKVFGAEAFWARIPSVFFGVGMIYLMYRMGARLFNRYVGLLAAFAGVLSIYLNFWSRMARNYAIFGFFFLLLGLVFLAALEGKSEREGSFWKKHGLDPKYLLLLPVVLLASLMSHQLTFFFVFSAAVYVIAVAVNKYVRRTGDRNNNPYLWLSALGLPFLLLVFVPALNGVIKGILGAFLPARIVEWVIPQWSRIAELWQSKPWEAFDMYNGVLRYDPTILYYPALAGLVAAFWLRPRSGAWLLSSVAVPFVLMCFVFREPADPRYMIGIFPYFLIAAAAFFYAAWQYLAKGTFAGSGRMQWVLLLLPFIFVVASVRWKELKSLVLAEKLNEHVVDMNITTWAFINWKEPSEFIQREGKSGDIIMATVPTAASYYLKNDDVLWFRQSYYDTKQKKYVFNEPDSTVQNSASSFYNLVRTYERNPRGWLLADYYFDNIFTDDRARMFVYQNMYFYPEASRDGGVMLFGWDRSRPKPQQQNLVVELGKTTSKVVSKDYIINPPEALLQQPELRMIVRARHVNNNREAFILFNDQNAVYLPPNKGKDIETLTLAVRSEWLRPGPNKVQICYDDQVKNDKDPGFALYYLALDQ
ncbi:MAG: glycosyltransferase family 39 protein [Saprospiraceae bacterium]|nr:glycosyltransferase family 39 protein [Saprospiraceae bacterium]